jgi:predicted transcriptional regulator of viral defense system
MQTLAEKVWHLHPPAGLFDKQVIDALFPDASPGAKQALLNKALRSKDIIRIAPGAYCLAREFRDRDPHPFSIAAFIHSPSYVTLETALAFHRMIPEAVHQVVSGISARSKESSNEFGRFAFRRILCAPFLTGVQNIKVEEGVWAYIAGPARAIADLVYVRSEVSVKKDGIRFLTESMRIDSDDLLRMDIDELSRVRRAFGNRRVKEYLDMLQKEVHR